MANAEVSKAVQQDDLTVSARFTNLVLKEFTASVGGIEVSPAQRSLIQGYFIGCDKAIATNEDDRVSKGLVKKLPYTWANVMVDATLAQDIVSYAKLGLDMTIPNSLFPVLRMNHKTNKYKFTFQPGFEGRKIVAKKYSIDPIVDIDIALVYANDKFVPHYKDSKHEHTCFELEITNPFDRGELAGGYGFIEYEDKRKNTLVILSKKDIDKRKACAMNQVFWSKWYEQMALKTVAIATCKQVTIDSNKIDDNYRRLLANESECEETDLEEEINDNANGDVIDVTPKAEEPKQIERQEVKPPVVEGRVISETVEEPVPAQPKAAEPKVEFEVPDF